MLDLGSVFEDDGSCSCEGHKAFIDGDGAYKRAQQLYSLNCFLRRRLSTQHACPSLPWFMGAPISLTNSSNTKSLPIP